MTTVRNRPQQRGIVSQPTRLPKRDFAIEKGLYVPTLDLEIAAQRRASKRLRAMGNVPNSAPERT